VSWLSWIKNAIGMDEAAAPPAATTEHDREIAPAREREDGRRAAEADSHAPETDAREIHPAVERPNPPLDRPPDPRIDPPRAPAAQSASEPPNSFHRDEDPARAAGDDDADAISLEPTTREVDIDVEIAVEPASAAQVEHGVDGATIIELEPREPPTAEEIDRRRAMVRGYFNDYWSSIEDKPASFAERLDHAESYINERVAAGGEAWRLSPATRRQLGLPPSRSAESTARRR
jgi:hypothetical protein